jgi:class 3 adenylate cyclase/tetratricopeptide (TPR) repeat protein
MAVEVRKWLQENGFGRYADLFEALQVDGEALHALTDAHLKELGIPLGPRAKLLRALARLQPGADGAATAERRQLTLMFVDLVGSTALSGRLDPEDLRKVIRTYQGVVASEIARYEGHVAQYLGDGVLAYFGFPVAHEDDAERAVRVALAILEAVPRLRAPGGESLAARIGIATGLVVVGDLLGEGNAKEHAVVGETPNLAARLQGLAEPGQVVVSARTRALIGQLFELRDLGPCSLKGIAVPVVAYAVVRAHPVVSRFEAHRAGRVAAMVGRDDELSVLTQRWRKASAGAGQLVLLTGEAGIGKSRIVRALQDAVSAEQHVRIGFQCSPYHSGSALFPVIQQLTRAAGIGQDDGPEQRLDRLEALLAGTPPERASDVALLAALLGIDGNSRYGPLKLSPRQQRTGTFNALLAQLARIAEQLPALVFVEDAQWIDPTTLELIDLCIERLAGMPVLIVVTARPDFEHDFGHRGEVTRLALNRLGRVPVAQIARQVARGKALPEELIDEIVAKTDGVPLFVEEITKTMIESGLLRETVDAFVLEGPLQTLALPTSLRDSLTARLDRLQPVREVAQIAACIGREFGYRLLAAISSLREHALRDALARLVDAELLYRKATANEVYYSFKHALVRDAAYESLLKEKRRRIHAQLVAALEVVPGTPPELIAQHASRAELREKAIDYWQKAAVEAIARPAYKEAIAHLTQALQLAEQMGEETVWQERRLLLLISLGQASIPLRGYGHPATVAAFTRAQQLVDTMAGAPHRFPIFYAVWVAHYVRGEQDTALATARRMVEQADRDRNAGHMLTALRSLAMSQMITGALAPALACFQQAQRLSDASPQRSREQRIATADRFANDPEIGTRVHFTYTLWCLGRVDEARHLLAEAVAAARALGHAHTLCHVLSYSSMLAALCGHVDEALALSGETLDLAGRHEFEMLFGYGSCVHAFVLSLKGELTASVSEMERAFGSLARAHAGTTVPVFWAIQARTLGALGRWGDAERYAALVRDQLRSGSERFYWPECQRLLGDYLRLRPGTADYEIEEAYGHALSIAHEQQAKIWEFFAAFSLARWWAEHGAHEKARSLLTPLRAEITEASQLLALTEADEFLNALRR